MKSAILPTLIFTMWQCTPTFGVFAQGQIAPVADKDNLDGYEQLIATPDNFSLNRKPALLFALPAPVALAREMSLSPNSVNISQATSVVQIPTIPTSPIPAPTITLPLTPPTIPQSRPKPTPVAPLPRGLPAPPESEQPPVAPLPRGLPAPLESEQPPVAPLPRGLPAPPENEQPPVAPLPRGLPAPPESEQPPVAPLPREVPTSAPEPAVTQRIPAANRIAAQRAWQYFDRNWNPQTGMVNAVDKYPWTTLWDQGSAILGIHAAYQLGLIEKEKFDRMVTRLLQTLGTLPLPATGLPNKAYSTSTAEMRRLNNTPDPRGTSGWSALDTARLLMGLHVLRSHYPEYRDRITRIVARWDLPKLVKDGWLQGGVPESNSKISLVQEGRLGYEQYASHSLKLWNLEATNALNNPPVDTIKVDGINLIIDRRNLANSGASNYLTSDPYVLWGLEMGWPDAVKPQVKNIFQLQAQRFQRTGILTAVNEDSLDRPPYFLYYSIYANGQPWHAINDRGRSYPNLRFLSTKAAFAWGVLMEDNAYAKKLRDAVQNLSDGNRGYFSGRYENNRLGLNTSVDVNTNAIILESLLYQVRGGRPLVF